MPFLRWLAGFLEQGPAQSSARLIAIGGFVVAAALSFTERGMQHEHVIEMFLLGCAVAIALHTLTSGGGP